MANVELAAVFSAPFTSDNYISIIGTGETSFLSGSTGMGFNWQAAFGLSVNGAGDGSLSITAGAPASGDNNGGTINIVAGGSSGAANGGGIFLYAGNSGPGNIGGAVVIVPGQGGSAQPGGDFSASPQYGGNVLFNMADSGPSPFDGIGGGGFSVNAGPGSLDANGGNIYFETGDGNGTGVAGNFGINLSQVGATPGNLLIAGLPTADPHVSTAIYNDSGTLKISAG